jgi:hypothetical protein
MRALQKESKKRDKAAKSHNLCSALKIFNTNPESVTHQEPQMLPYGVTSSPSAARISHLFDDCNML